MYVQLRLWRLSLIKLASPGAVPKKNFTSFVVIFVVVVVVVVDFLGFFFGYCFS